MGIRLTAPFMVLESLVEGSLSHLKYVFGWSSRDWLVIGNVDEDMSKQDLIWERSAEGDILFTISHCSGTQ